MIQTFATSVFEHDDSTSPTATLSSNNPMPGTETFSQISVRLLGDSDLFMNRHERRKAAAQRRR